MLSCTRIDNVSKILMDRTPLQSGPYLHQHMDPRHLTSPLYANPLSSNPEQFKRLSMVGAPSSSEHPLVKQEKLSPFPLSRSILQSAGSFLQGGPRACLSSGPQQVPKTLELSKTPVAQPDNHTKLPINQSGMAAVIYSLPKKAFEFFEENLNLLTAPFE